MDVLVDGIETRKWKYYPHDWSRDVLNL
jgi:hypothetical protein